MKEKRRGDRRMKGNDEDRRGRNEKVEKEGEVNEGNDVK